MIDKRLTFLAQYAAPSMSTGNFIACVVDSDIEAVRSAFSFPGAILVHNTEGLYSDAIYSGYSDIKRIHVSEEGIIVTVYKEENHGAE